MNSKRIPGKNLRLLNGKPLVGYIIEAAKKSRVFDDIYINSEDEVFREIASYYGIQFYKRDASLAADDVTNDAFAADFIKNIQCETLIQLLATSPFITGSDITGFAHYMDENDFDTLVSVENIQIECLYKGNPVNFERDKITLPSQDLIAIQKYSCGIMGWKTKTYIKNMGLGGAYHGNTGSTGYYPLKGYATIDIDIEEDFKLAERVAEVLEANPAPPLFYKPIQHSTTQEVLGVEGDVKSILEKDGINKTDWSNQNREINNVYELIQKMGKGSWSSTLVNTENNSACLICQNPGEGNRRHYHPKWNEWWLIIDGEYEFEMGGKVRKVKTGDLVFAEKNIVHKITAIGNKPAIRLAVSRQDIEHVYVK